MDLWHKTALKDWYCDDIRLTHTLSHYQKEGKVAVSNQTDVVRLHFGLKGNYHFLYKQLNQTFKLIGGHHNIMYSNGFDIEVQNKSLELETFGIQFPKEVFIAFTQNPDDKLKQFTEDILSGKNVLLSNHWAGLNASIEQVINQIIHCRYQGQLQKIFLLSKSLELLVLSVEAYNKVPQKGTMLIKTATDKEKINAVRDLVNERLTDPPSLSEIAQAVGLNEYKLKRGFKEIFSSTVFEYLTEQRLNLANQHLLDTQKTSAEIAYDLGYKTPQHFNNAFKKKFGITPNSIRNNPD